MQQPIDPPNIRMPYWPFDLGTVTDLFGIAFAVIGLLVAWRVYRFTKKIGLRQLEIMDEQTAMMKRQDEANERMETLTIEQAAIAKRQGEIAEAQHRIMQEQLAKAPNPVFYITGGSYEDGGWRKYALYLHNTGSRTLRQFHWEIYIKFEHSSSAHLSVADSREHSTPSVLIPEELEGEDLDKYLYKKVSGFREEPIHPKQPVHFGDIQVQKTLGLQPLDLKWSIDSEDGAFPRKGTHGQVRLPMFYDADEKPVDIPPVDK